jgi:CheY-like chemotaxis protein
MSAKRILIIDDEKAIRQVVQICLSSLGGYEVLEAISGEDGLRIAETEHPDAIVLDLTMPQMDGLTVLQHLHENPTTRSIPIVVLSAKTYLVARQQFSQVGVVAAIAKPFNPLTLSHQIAIACGWA